MGDVAIMILEGAICQECGEYLDDDLDFPHSCNGCQNTHQIKRKGKHETNSAEPGTPYVKP